MDSQARMLRRIASARLPTRWGMFNAIGFERHALMNPGRIDTALTVIMGDTSPGVPLLRVHSQCFTGEFLGSLRCDCRDQLEIAMQAIANERRGIVIYEYQEGRGIGLMSKLNAYELQDAGLDTVDANMPWGSKPTTGISAYPWKFCAISASDEYACSRTIRARSQP